MGPGAVQRRHRMTVLLREVGPDLSLRAQRMGIRCSHDCFIWRHLPMWSLRFEFHAPGRVPSAERHRLTMQERDQSQVIDIACDLKILGKSGWRGTRVARICAEVSLALHKRIASRRETGATGAAEAARRTAPIVGVVSPGTAGPGLGCPQASSPTGPGLGRASASGARPTCLRAPATPLGDAVAHRPLSPHRRPAVRDRGRAAPSLSRQAR